MKNQLINYYFLGITYLKRENVQFHFFWIWNIKHISFTQSIYKSNNNNNKKINITPKAKTSIKSLYKNVLTCKHQECIDISDLNREGKGE